MNWEGFFKTWEKPSLFLFGIALLNCYIPAIIGASIPTGWIFLIIFSPVLLCFYNTRITNSHILGFIFLIFVTISLSWTKVFNFGFFILLQIFALSMVFCLASDPEFKIKTVLAGMGIGILSSDILSFLQYYYNYDGVFTVLANPAGLFVNKNIFCEVSVILFLGFLVFRMWWYIPFILPGILIVHSRGAILGLIVGFTIWAYRENKTFGFIVTAFTVLCASLYAMDNNSLNSVFERFDLWADGARGITFFGNGVGSYETMFPYYATHIDTSLSRPRFAHNDLLQLFFEFGIFGLIPLFIVLNLLKVKSNAKPIIYAIGTISMFNYTLHVPISAFLAFLFAGYITRFDDTIWNTSIYKRSNLYKVFKAKGYALSKISR